ncbi:DUF3955 domain-containing protein [Halodesulfovibrio sp.]|uniref:DUF3955 domain-containing protein n=1 Tax=Halodesulfovibrio sp. TaxID=1912772 RepID=UPI0034257257
MNFFKRNLAWIFLALSVFLFVRYHMVGSYIDENGFLIEPFYLIPLSWLCFFASMFCFILKFTRRKKNRRTR